ncbi:hypothetical protein CEXT_11201 [Caerostris extrusa]|uniref:Uncharacterized protein n=1 Tax=Caerostris extrusa TaxID=172846 RepID=A0AAV4XGD1_CAEEX|nr:hypothetical protein CEXT_11201 [Caerostris extrusa]
MNPNLGTQSPGATCCVLIFAPFSIPQKHQLIREIYRQLGNYLPPPPLCLGTCNQGTYHGSPLLSLLSADCIRLFCEHDPNHSKNTPLPDPHTNSRLAQTIPFATPEMMDDPT